MRCAAGGGASGDLLGIILKNSGALTKGVMATSLMRVQHEADLIGCRHVKGLLSVAFYLVPHSLCESPSFWVDDSSTPFPLGLQTESFFLSPQFLSCEIMKSGYSTVLPPFCLKPQTH